MADINYLLLLSRWVHIMAVASIVGAIVFKRFALLPSIRETLDDETRGRVHEAVRRRWARLVHGCIAALLVTGITNFVILALPMKSPPIAYHAIFGVKVLSALLLFFVASALASRSAGLAGIRQRPGRWLTIGLVLAALIVALSGALGQIRAGAAAGTTAAVTTDAAGG